jgi:hypothetical protein
MVSHNETEIHNRGSKHSKKPNRKSGILGAVQEENEQALHFWGAEGAYWPRVARIWRLPEPRGRPLRRPELKLACSPSPAVCTPLSPAASLGFSAPKLHGSGVAVASSLWPGATGGGDGVGDVDGNEGEEWYSFAASCASVMDMSAPNIPWPDSWPTATAMPSLPSIEHEESSSWLVSACFLLLVSWFASLDWIEEEDGQEVTPALVFAFHLCLVTKHQQAAAVCTSIYPSHRGKDLKYGENDGNKKRVERFWGQKLHKNGGISWNHPSLPFWPTQPIGWTAKMN